MQKLDTTSARTTTEEGNSVYTPPNLLVTQLQVEAGFAFTNANSPDDWTPPSGPFWPEDNS